MKGNISQGLLTKKERGWLSGTMDGRIFRDWLLLLVSCFLLCGARLWGQELPLGACMVAALPLGISSLTAAFGSMAGYFLFTSGTSRIEFLALTVLMLASVALFQSTSLWAKRWFMPTMSSGVCTLLHGVRFAGGETSLSLLLIYCLCGGVFCAVFRSAVAGEKVPRLVFLAAAIAGLGSVPAPINLGLLLAVALAVASGKIHVAAILGIALDLSGSGLGYTVALSAPAVFSQSIPLKLKNSIAVSYLLFCNLAFLLMRDLEPRRCIAVALGTAAGLILNRFCPQEREDKSRKDNRLQAAMEVMEMLREQLPHSKTPACIGEAESVFDGAAERVCRCCERFHRCWQNRAKETYEALSSAARAIIERGVAQRDDLPQEFQNRCCHLEGFITAINQELEGMLFRRRYRMQLEESRQVLIEQMDCLTEFLKTAQTEQACNGKKRVSFLPRVGICTKGKDGSRISGDRGACFAGGQSDYFVLLCDGMGTGLAAHRMCGETLGLLERMLKTGLAPDAALKLLNGVELLRGDDRYTTVDLLHLSLAEGKGTLYKWGAAPSYWRCGEEMKKIGTATPPPGVGVGGEHAPERYELSLKEGELLVLTSDGAGGIETETVISGYHGTSPQELAALLISAQNGEDDMSAVVISLQAYAS